MEKTRVVTGISCNESEVKISLLKVSDKPGIAFEIFATLVEAGINVDMIIQNVQQNNFNDITFTIEEEDLSQARIILEELQTELRIEEIIFNTELAKVSIIGGGMLTNSGIAAKIFSALANKNINIKLISTSEIKVSCLINEAQAEKAVKAINDEFELA
ncbi:ACT domain-containing protein [Sporohalobacter salinus]|uniref:ACT domain-containing protein n=1 Tax=Sporohalobacter salinus TaxID=1494606 RepID=UPI001EF8C133|nr:ACT domain-containing protein [Sporohalobacter salinus]MBM7624431.1 aspartate kinase [Sporohalobacter salinus]